MIKSLKKMWKNEYFQTAVMIGLIVLVVIGFWYGSQAVLNTSYPALAVKSGSMCIPYDQDCDGFSHPFDRTLHIGDLIIIQGVDPASLNDDYPNSDIIVFHDPRYPGETDELIVHRIVKTEVIDGKIYFYTKGDGNGDKWPSMNAFSEYDPWPNGGRIPQDLVVGKVVMHVPWIGHLVLFMRGSFGVPVVVVIVVLLIIIEFVIPALRKEKQQPSKQDQPASNGEQSQVNL